MRTTVTLDPDVEQLLRVIMRERGVSLNEALNQAIRASGSTKRRARFTQRTFAMGAEQHFQWDKALAVADAIEDEGIFRFKP